MRTGKGTPSLLFRACVVMVFAISVITISISPIPVRADIPSADRATTARPDASHAYYIHLASTHSVNDYEYYCVRLLSPSSVTLAWAYQQINDGLFSSPDWQGVAVNRVLLQQYPGYEGYDCAQIDSYTQQSMIRLEYWLYDNWYGSTQCGASYNCQAFAKTQFYPAATYHANLIDYGKSIQYITISQLYDTTQRRASVNHETGHAFGLSDPPNTQGHYCGNSVMHSNYYGCANDPYHSNSLNIPGPSTEDIGAVTSIAYTGQFAHPNAKYRHKPMLWTSPCFYYLQGGQSGFNDSPSYSTGCVTIPGSTVTKPFAGSWDGTRDSVGLVDISNPPWANFYLFTDPLNPSTSYQVASLCCLEANDIPIAGRFFPNDPVSRIGIYRPGTSEFWWKQSNLVGSYFDYYVHYGGGGYNELPIVGDWQGNGQEKVGVWYKVYGGQFYLRADMNGRSSWWYEPGLGDMYFPFGCASCGDLPIAGDWNGDDAASIGVYSPCSNWWSLKDSELGLQSADMVTMFGGCSFVPLRGNWNGGY